MNTNRIIVSIVFCTLFVTQINGQKLTKLYKKNQGAVAISSTDSKKYVDIQVIVNDNLELYKKSTTLKKTYLSELSDRGQKAYIEGFNKYPKKGEDLYKLLSKPLKEPAPSASINKDYTKFVVHLEFDVMDVFSSSVTNNGRISELSLRTTLSLPSDIELYSFKEFNTIYENINFGDIEETRTRNFSLNAGIEILGTGSSTNTTPVGNNTSVIGGTTGQTSNFGSSFGSSKSSTEKIQQLSRVISQMGTMTDESFFILQQGTPKNNLEGKISLDLVIKTKANISLELFKFSQFYIKGKIQTDPAKVKIQKYLATFPKISNNIKATTTYKFDYREITNDKGRKSKSEHDDNIKLNYLDESNKVIINTYDLATKNSVNKFNKYWLITNGTKILYINYQGKDLELKLGSMDNAIQMEQFLKLTNFVSLGGFKLRYGIPGSISDLQTSDIPNIFALKH